MAALDFDTLTDLQVGAACMAADALARTSGAANVAAFHLSPETALALAALDRKVIGSAKLNGVTDKALVNFLRMGAIVAFGVRLADATEGRHHV